MYPHECRTEGKTEVTHRVFSITGSQRELKEAQVYHTYIICKHKNSDNLPWLFNFNKGWGLVEMGWEWGGKVLMFYATANQSKSTDRKKITRIYDNTTVWLQQAGYNRAASRSQSPTWSLDSRECHTVCLFYFSWLCYSNY